MTYKYQFIPLEKDIQRAICDWLALKGFLFWRSNNIPVFGTNNAGRKTFRSLPKYTPRGLPDIICIREGKFIAFEVKRPGAKLSPEQADFATKLITNGAHYHMVSSLDQVIEIMK